MAARPAAVASVLARSAQWTSTRRKSDGKPFYYIQGNTPGSVYMTDATGCTCSSAQNRPGPCKHSLAVAEYLARRAPKSDAALLEQLKADHVRHAKVLVCVGWEHDELYQNPMYSQRVAHIARLESAATGATVAA